MKKLLDILLSIIFLLIFGCSEKGEIDTPDVPIKTYSLSINPLSFVCSEVGENINVTVLSSNNWTLSGSVSWCVPSATTGKNGDVIIFSAQENNTPDERSASYTFTCGDKTVILVVTQKQKNALTVTKSNYDVKAQGGTIDIEVKANIDYSYEIRNDWIKYVSTKTMTSKMLTFSVEASKETDQREGTIVFSSGKLLETIRVTQAQKDTLSIVQDNYEIDNDGGVIKIEVNSNTDYTVEISESSKSWVSQVTTRGFAKSEVNFNIAVSDLYKDRNGIIIIKNISNASSHTITIKQHGLKYTDNIWDGTVANGFADGNGSENNPYLIATGAHLAKLANDVNNGTSYSGQYFKLMDNIDLSNKVWTPIGKVNAQFKGVFDGNENIVSNAKIQDENNEYVGLWGYIKESKISNLSASNTLNIIGGKYVGGICGYADNSQIINCVNKSVISSRVNNSHIGGLCGYIASGKIENCSNLGEINTSSLECEVGGIVGTSYGIITNCENKATITGSDMKRSSGTSCLAGICGYQKNSNIYNCKNYGAIYSSSSIYYMACLGGIAGRSDNNVIHGSYNEGYIQSDKYDSGNSGGICGWLNGTVMGSVNCGNIQTSFPNYYLNYSHSSGGICGSGSNGNTGLVVIACYNTGDIYCKGRLDHAGGISGTSYSGNFYSCYNIGTITGNYAGGVIGEIFNIGKFYTGLWLEGTVTDKSDGYNTEYLQNSSSELNQGISKWNNANPALQCKYFFEKTVSGINDGYPLIKTNSQ